MIKKFGIDLSTWQRAYPYQEASEEGVKFAILRAGFSTTEDNMFETHYKNAKKQGWGVGAYWYTYAKTISEAKKEVKAFLNTIKGKKFEYPIYVDVEDASIRNIGRLKLNSIIKTFAKEIKKAGYCFGVYTNADWYRNKISGSILNKDYEWWIASWTSYKPSDITAELWQFGGSSNAIRSSKIGGVVTDQNYAYKDYPKYMKDNGLNGYKKIYTKGNYKTLSELNIRTGAGTIYKKKKVKSVSKLGKKAVTSKNLNDYAVYKKGITFTALKIIKNKSGNIWAKTPSGYVCIKDKKKTYCRKK